MINECDTAYKSGLLLMEANLPPINSSYLGLVLNYAVFYFEILNMNTMAIEIAQKVQILIQFGILIKNKYAIIF